MPDGDTAHLGHADCLSQEYHDQSQKTAQLCLGGIGHICGGATDFHFKGFKDLDFTIQYG